MFHFIDHIADFIIEKHRAQLKDLKIIFPNRRAALFLEKRLSQKLQQIYINPQFFSIDSLVNHHIHLVVPERITLIHMLYETFKENGGNQEESFAHFYSYGDKLLRDFDLMDKYLVNAPNLFTTINDINQIDELFELEDEEVKRLIKDFWSRIIKADFRGNNWSSMWVEIGTIYYAYREKLLQENLAYSGMKYRALAENLDVLDSWKQAPTIVAGFNRLSKSEEKILTKLKHADFFWDIDNYYKENHIAGRFINKNVTFFGNKMPASNLMEERDKNVTIINIPKSNTQSQIAMKFISDNGWDPEKTMILLADESQLLPLLTSIPEQVDKLNISMGWSISQSPIAGLIKQILNVHLHYDKELFNYPSLLVRNIVKNAYISELLPMDYHIDIHNEWKEVQSLLDVHEVLNLVFTPLQQPIDIFDRIISIIEHIFKNQISHNADIEESSEGLEIHGSGVFVLEVLRYTHQKILRLQDIFTPIAESVDLRQLLYLFNQIFSSERIPFTGEPLAGLQILGPLESRSLDYDHVIIFDMKEGAWPPTYSDGVIPYSLKKAYGMPTSEEELAEYAYYFWSIISKTKDVVLLNPSDYGILQPKLPSRFLIELQSLQEYFNIQELELPQRVNLANSHEIIIDKDDVVMQKIDTYLEHGISASSMLDFAECSLKFYFKKILKLRESREYSEEFDAALFGSIFHQILEDLYKPYLNGKITDEIIERLIQELPRRIDHVYHEAFQLNEQLTSFGQHHFYKKILYSYAISILEYDQKRVPFTVLAVEYGFKKKDIPIGDRSFTFIGKIDRVDLKDDKVYTIDYKSGREEPRYTIKEDSLEEAQIHKLRNGLQSAIYAYFYSDGNAIPQIFSVKNVIDFQHINSASITFKSNKTIFNTEDRHELVEKFIAQFINRLLDKNRPFQKTDKIDNCKYCPFIFICEREQQVSRLK